MSSESGKAPSAEKQPCYQKHDLLSLFLSRLSLSRERHLLWNMKWQIRILQQYPFYLRVCLSSFYWNSSVSKDLQELRFVGSPSLGRDQYYTFLQVPIQMHYLFISFSTKCFKKITFEEYNSLISYLYSA